MILKYYVVRKGRKTWIFLSWEEIKLYVSGYPDAKYKSFSSLASAEEAFTKNWESYYETRPKKNSWKEQDLPFEKNAIAVDAACSGNPGVLEYRGVDLQTGEEIFYQHFECGTNNIWEFLALVHWMSRLQQKNIDRAVYSDSRIALNWVKIGKCRTKISSVDLSDGLANAIQRAENWLKEKGIQFQLLKWNTEEWWEIPADFGRK